MSLSNLTSGGWVVFAVALLLDVKLIGEYSMHAFALHKGLNPTKQSFDILLPVIFTVWFLYLVAS